MLFFVELVVLAVVLQELTVAVVAVEVHMLQLLQSL
jgi:hypothetical protein